MNAIFALMKTRLPTLKTELKAEMPLLMCMLPATLILLLILLMSTCVWAQDSNPCAQISCSGQGTCVMVENRPVCSCNQGFVPDAETQLTCIPYDVAVNLKSSATPAQPVAEEPKNEELAQVEKALRKRNLSDSFRQFKLSNPNTHYAWFWYQRYEKRKKLGSFLIGFGAASFVLGLGGVLASSNIHATAGDLLAFGGAAVMGIGVLSTAVGVPIYVVCRRKMNRLERLKPESSVSSISPAVVVNKTTFGIGMNVAF